MASRALRCSVFQGVFRRGFRHLPGAQGSRTIGADTRADEETTMFRALSAAVLAAAVAACAPAPTATGAGGAPMYRVDPAWPQALPEGGGVHLVFGQVAGIAVDDRNGHVWMVHRPASLLPDEVDPKTNKPRTHRCCEPRATLVDA